MIVAINKGNVSAAYRQDAFFALVFGLLGGYILKKTRSLYPVLAAHILFNLINVAIYIL